MIVEETAFITETEDEFPEETPALAAGVPDESARTLFLPGEIVRKRMKIREKPLEPNLGIVRQAYDHESYRVDFYDLDAVRTDIFWNEDLEEVNAMELDLLLKDYPLKIREQLLKNSRPVNGFAEPVEPGPTDQAGTGSLV